MNAKFAEQAPTLTEFLSKVSVPLPVMNETLAHMEESGDESAAVAKWFLKNHRDVWASGSPPTSPDACRARSSHPAIAAASMAAPPRFVLSPQCRSRALPRPDGQPVGLFPLGRPREKAPPADPGPQRGQGAACPAPSCTRIAACGAVWSARPRPRRKRRNGA